MLCQHATLLCFLLTSCFLCTLSTKRKKMPFKLKHLLKKSWFIHSSFSGSPQQLTQSLSFGPCLKWTRKIYLSTCYVLYNGCVVGYGLAHYLAHLDIPHKAFVLKDSHEIYECPCSCPHHK